jgi:hypothetical protein
MHLSHILVVAFGTASGVTASCPSEFECKLFVARLSRLLFADHPVPLCKGVDIEDATIESLQQYMMKGKLTSVDLVNCYLARIEKTNK